jgi:hypothetical protein
VSKLSELVDEKHADAVAELIRKRDGVTDFSIAGMARGWKLTIRTAKNRMVYRSTRNGRDERYDMILRMAQMCGVPEREIEEARKQQ